MSARETAWPTPWPSNLNLIVDKLLTVNRKEKNLRRMNTAVKLNQLVKDRSSGTQLLVINLPGAPAEENDWLHCILLDPQGWWVKRFGGG